MKIVAISGSLRANSYNSAILKIAENFFTPLHEYYFFPHLDKIPPFNPDTELHSKIIELEELKNKISQADFVIISTPEYIHSLPGSLKNLFDWLVGTAVLDGKKTALIVASSSDGTFAKNQLHEIVNVMTGGNVIVEASFEISGIKTKFNEHHELIDDKVKKQLNNLYETLSKHNSK